MDDTSLDDFLSGSDSEERASSEGDDTVDAADNTDGANGDDTVDAANGANTADAGGDHAVDDPSATDGDAVEPARTTSRWDADGVVCTDCGEQTSRVWESQTGLVCAACKEW